MKTTVIASTDAAIIKKMVDQKRAVLTHITKTYGVDLDKARDIRLWALNPDRSSSDYVIEEEPITIVSSKGGREKYRYNSITKEYSVFLRSMGRTWVVPEEVHKGMMKAYTGASGKVKCIDKISQDFGITREAFSEYKKIMGWTHTSSPFTPEQLKVETDEEIVQDVEQARIFGLNRQISQNKWNATQVSAQKWDMLQAGKVDPFGLILRNYNPEPLPVITQRVKVPKTEKTLLLGLSDIHFGSIADATDLVHGSDYDIKKAQDVLQKYAQDVEDAVKRDNISSCIVCVIGDILHSLTGRTKKGTPLDFDVIGADQFSIAMNSIILYLERMATLFENVTVQQVKGNHAGDEETCLFIAVAQHFRLNPRIKFELHKARSAFFRVNNVAVILDHGESDYVKANVPKGKAREAWIQSIFITEAQKGNLTGVKQKLFIQGDKHHYEQIEYNDFEYFMFGAPVLGDRYADHINKHSRARQNAIIISENDIQAVLHFYFD